MRQTIASEDVAELLSQLTKYKYIIAATNINRDELFDELEDLKIYIERREEENACTE